MEEFHGLLDGSALAFYWSCRRNNRFITWTLLRQAFRDRFQNFCNDNVIRLNLENRRQKEGESFLIFYNDLLDIANRLRNPLSPTELLFLLNKNMSPALQIELAPYIPHNVGDLVQRCLNIESTWEGLKSYQNIFRPRRSVNEIQYQSPSANFEQYDTSRNENFEVSNFNQIDAVHASYSKPSTTQLQCWNCSGPHRYHDCSVMMKEPFCYGSEEYFGSSLPNLQYPNAKHYDPQKVFKNQRFQSHNILNIIYHTKQKNIAY